MLRHIKMQRPKLGHTQQLEENVSLVCTFLETHGEPPSHISQENQRDLHRPINGLDWICGYAKWEEYMRLSFESMVVTTMTQEYC